ncbi:hypothetical protein SFRURICE_005463, partial [Spodoptera frugiperda]
TSDDVNFLYVKFYNAPTYQTRHKDRLSQPFFRLSKISKSFMGFCVKCYNRVPMEIQNLNESKFKLCIKKTLCRQAYYKVNEYIEDKNAWRQGPAPQDNEKNVVSSVILTVNTNLTTPIKLTNIESFRLESEQYSNLAPKIRHFVFFYYFDISSVTLTVNTNPTIPLKPKSVKPFRL